MPPHAKDFFHAVAGVVGMPVQKVMRAVFLSEIALNSWQVREMKGKRAAFHREVNRVDVDVAMDVDVDVGMEGEDDNVGVELDEMDVDLVE